MALFKKLPSSCPKGGNAGPCHFSTPLRSARKDMGYNAVYFLQSNSSVTALSNLTGSSDGIIISKFMGT